MLCATNNDGIICDVTQRLLDRTGFALVDLIGQDIADVLRLTPSARDPSLDASPGGGGERALLLDTHADATATLVCSDGTLRPVRVSSAHADHPASGEHRVILAIAEHADRPAQDVRLADSEAHYRSLIEDQTDLVCLIETDLTLRFVNSAYARMQQSAAEDFIGHSVLEFVPEDEHPVVRAHLAAVLSCSDVLKDENRVIVADGTERWISWRNRAMRDANGEVTGIHAVGRDVTDRKRAELRLSESETRYRMLADHCTDMVFQLDRRLVRVYVSPACYEIQGYTAEELMDRGAFAETVVDQREDVLDFYRGFVEGRTQRGSFSYRVRHKDGHWVWVESNARAIHDPVTGECTGVIGTVRDISAMKDVEARLEEANRRLELLAITDGLTQLYNRRAFDDALRREYRRARRIPAPLALIMIDVDHFKPFNDLYGHLAGDLCLRRISRIILDSARRSEDVAARYGGEEFAVILPGTERDGAMLVAETIRRDVESLGIDHASSPHGRVSVSIGVASITGETAATISPEDLLRYADTALYEAKRRNRNLVVPWVASPALDTANAAGDHHGRGQTVP